MQGPVSAGFPAEAGPHSSSVNPCISLDVDASTGVTCPRLGTFPNHLNAGGIRGTNPPPVAQSGRCSRGRGHRSVNRGPADPEQRPARRPRAERTVERRARPLRGRIGERLAGRGRVQPRRLLRHRLRQLHQCRRGLCRVHGERPRRGQRHPGPRLRQRHHRQPPAGHIRQRSRRRRQSAPSSPPAPGPPGPP